MGKTPTTSHSSARTATGSGANPEGCRPKSGGRRWNTGRVHVAIVAASAPSHMHPHLAVVRELVRRGHRVSYLVGHHLAELAADTGADVVGCTSVLPGAPGVPGWPDDDVAGMRMFLDEAVHVLPQVHAALDRDR